MCNRNYILLWGNIFVYNRNYRIMCSYSVVKLKPKNTNNTCIMYYPVMFKYSAIIQRLSRSNTFVYTNLPEIVLSKNTLMYSNALFGTLHT